MARFKPYGSSLLPMHIQRWSRLLTNSPAKKLPKKDKQWLRYVKESLYSLLGKGKKVSSLELFFKHQFLDERKTQRLIIVLFFIESMNSLFGKALMDRSEITLPNGIQLFKSHKIDDVANCLICGADRTAVSLEDQETFLNKTNWASQQSVSICGDSSCKTQLYENILPKFKCAIDCAAAFGAQLLTVKRAETTESKEHLENMHADAWLKVMAAYEYWAENYHLAPLSDGSERIASKPRYKLDPLAANSELHTNIKRVSKDDHPLFGSRIFRDLQGKKIVTSQNKDGQPVDIGTGEKLDPDLHISSAELNAAMNVGARALRRPSSKKKKLK